VDGSVVVPVNPDFTWQGTNAENYQFELASDVDFTQIISTINTTATSVSFNGDLDSNTNYYWRVTASNACGDGLISAVFTFTTVPSPGDCPVGFRAVSHSSIDFENGAQGWTSQGTGNTWALSTQRSHSGTTSYFAVDPTTVSDQELITPEVFLPDGNSLYTLQFWNFQTMEARAAGRCWDGGLLEVSTDDGLNWTPITTDKMLTDPYDGDISSLPGTNGWCGDPQDWLNSIVDINDFAGQSVRFRFRLNSDTSVGREGWYIDDFVIQSCTDAPDLIFENGFEQTMSN
jgi:hypothetical protein